MVDKDEIQFRITILRNLKKAIDGSNYTLHGVAVAAGIEPSKLHKALKTINTDKPARIDSATLFLLAQVLGIGVAEFFQKED